jgi:hypothetical protein
MTVSDLKAELQSDLYKITATQNADLRVQKSDLLEKTKLLEGLLAECHAELVFCDPNTKVGERVENYFAGNGAILYSQLEIPEEKLASQVGTGQVNLEALDTPSTQEGYLELDKLVAQLEIPDGFRIRWSKHTGQTQSGLDLLRYDKSESSLNFVRVLHFPWSGEVLTDEVVEKIQNYINLEKPKPVNPLTKLEIPEEKPVPQDESNWVDIDTNTLKPGIFDGSFGGTYFTQDMIDDAKGAVSGAAFHDIINAISEFEKPKPVNPLSKLEIPIGYELSVGSDEGVGTIVVLMLRNSFTRKLTLLHMGSASLGLTDDEISSIQKRIDEVVG